MTKRGAIIRRVALSRPGLEDAFAGPVDLAQLAPLECSPTMRGRSSSLVREGGARISQATEAHRG